MKALSSIRSTLITGLALASCQLVQAATVVTFSSFDMSNTVDTGLNVSTATDNLGASDYVTLSGFDGSLGTLNSVTLEYYSMGQISDAYANFRDDDWYNETSGLTRLQGMQVSSTFLGHSYYRSLGNRSTTCSDQGGLTSGAACQADVGYLTRQLSNQSFLITDASTLASLTDIGSIGTTIYQSGYLYADETDGDDGYITSRYGHLRTVGYIRLIYDYTVPAPVPVPTAAWLFGSALLGLVGIGRKR